MRNNENDISDNIYEKLQNILNECIELWYMPRWFWEWKNIHIDPNYVEYDYSKYSYHELFSIENGIMEFVKWRCQLKERLYHRIDWKYDNDINVPEFHYMIMWPMAAEQKVQYFVANVIIASQK
jgi:hypothetical protein